MEFLAYQANAFPIADELHQANPCRPTKTFRNVMVKSQKNEKRTIFSDPNPRPDQGPIQTLFKAWSKT